MRHIKSSKEGLFLLSLINLILVGIFLLIQPHFSSMWRNHVRLAKEERQVALLDKDYAKEGVQKRQGWDGKKLLVAYYPKEDSWLKEQMVAHVEADARSLQVDEDKLVAYSSSLEDAALEGLQNLVIKRSVYPLASDIRKKEEAVIYSVTIQSDGNKANLASLFTDPEVVKDKMLEEFANQLDFRETDQGVSNQALNHLEEQDLADWTWTYQDGAFHVSSGQETHSLPLVTLFPYIQADYLKGSDKEAYDLYLANRDKKLVALTFDDGPDPRTTPQVLDLLKAHKAKATFFVVGQHIAGNEAIMKRALSEGSEIGNHSWSHPNMPLYPLATVGQEITSTHDEIKRATGVDTNLMRPPYGAITPAIQTSFNQRFIMWSVDTLDWKNRNTTSIMSQVKANLQPGGIILMHDIHQTTVDALPSLLDYLDQEGYEYVTVSDLIGKDAPLNSIYYSNYSK